MTVEILDVSSELPATSALGAERVLPAERAGGPMPSRGRPRTPPSRPNVPVPIHHTAPRSSVAPTTDALATSAEPTPETAEQTPAKVTAAAALEAPPPVPAPTVSQPAVSKPSPNKAGYYRLLRAVVERHREYPRNARRARLQGTVVVRLNVSRAGQLLGARVAHSSGEAVLDEAALSSVRLAGSFPAAPAALGNEPITVDMPFVFRLQ